MKKKEPPQAEAINKSMLRLLKEAKHWIEGVGNIIDISEGTDDACGGWDLAERIDKVIVEAEVNGPGRKPKVKKGE